MNTKVLLLGVDGGGTSCRARLCAFSGQARDLTSDQVLDEQVLGEAATGPANLLLGVQHSFAEILAAATACLEQAGLARSYLRRTVACLALAGASEPAHLAAAQAYPHPFRRAMITTDAHAACIGAHGEADGGVIVAGTGSVGWAVVGGRTHRVGGWGMPISDEGSGAMARLRGRPPPAVGTRWPDRLDRIVARAEREVRQRSPRHRRVGACRLAGRFRNARSGHF